MAIKNDINIRSGSLTTSLNIWEKLYKELGFCVGRRLKQEVDKKNLQDAICIQLLSKKRKPKLIFCQAKLFLSSSEFDGLATTASNLS
jgi:hypothetical protein